jgi:hypothetical protein
MCMFITNILSLIRNNNISSYWISLTNINTLTINNFIYIISYDATIYYSILICGFILTLSSYVSMLFIPLLIFFILFPLSNPYLISNSSHQPEYLYVSLLYTLFKILLKYFLSTINCKESLQFNLNLIVLNK